MLPSPPRSITAAEGTKANAGTSNPFGISVAGVPRNANESKTFSDGYYANLYETWFLSLTAQKLLCICTFWLSTDPTTIRELSFRYGLPRKTELEKQSPQRMTGRVTTFVTLQLGFAMDRIILSERGVRIGLSKSTQSQGQRLPQEASSQEA